jgi:isopentenyl diphosphate isomerase/L-lactate dehydrogenase-like FMN-dependent dehydrogenase
LRAAAADCGGGGSCVLVGRPALWGLSLGGRAGVERALDMLSTELLTVMQLCGCADIASIGRGHVRDKGGNGAAGGRPRL